MAASETYTVQLSAQQRDELLELLRGYKPDGWRSVLFDLERDLSVAAPDRKAA